MTDLQLQRLKTAAEQLGISIPKLKDLIYEGKLQAYRIGPKNCIRVPQSEIDRARGEQEAERGGERTAYRKQSASW